MIFDILSTLIIYWIERQQKIALGSGISLDRQSYQDAKVLGVVNPEFVRILYVDSIKVPLAVQFLHKLIKCKVPLKPWGLPCGYGIFIDRFHPNKRALLAHELVHVAQFERIGNLEDFITEYLVECRDKGYCKNKFEQEAYKLDIQF